MRLNVPAKESTAGAPTFEMEIAGCLEKLVFELTLTQEELKRRNTEIHRLNNKKINLNTFLDSHS